MVSVNILWDIVVKKFSNSELNWNIVEKEAFAVVHNIRHFQHFLVGYSFTVRCDNRVVTYLQTKHQPRNKKLLHWALELSEYDYTITHIPSKNNTISGHLSCNSFVSTIHNIDNHFKIDEFAIAQQNDPEITSALRYIQQNKQNFDVTILGSLKAHTKHLNIRDNILMWKNKYVVPKQLRSDVLKLCNDHPSSGHFAIQRTLDRFQIKYFWPNALLDVTNWVQSCHQCNKFNPPRTGHIKALLQPIESDQRFQLVCYDLAGPFLPITSCGNRYALIIVDHFSHWPEFVPLSDIEAPTIVMALIDHWFFK